MEQRHARVRRVLRLHPPRLRRPARRRGSTDDLVGVLCHAEIDGDSLDDDSLVHETLLILIGGDETTRHVISGGVEELLAHPDQVARLAADPAGLMPGAVEEMLRWVSPIKNMARTATRDVELAGAQHPGRPGAPPALPVGQPRRGGLRATPTPSTSPAAPTRTWPSASAPTSAWATSWPAWSSRVMVERVLARLPDLRLAVERGALPRRQANFISGIEEMPVEFTPDARRWASAPSDGGATGGAGGHRRLVHPRHRRRQRHRPGHGGAPRRRRRARHDLRAHRAEAGRRGGAHRRGRGRTAPRRATWWPTSPSRSRSPRPWRRPREATGRIDGLFACAGGSTAHRLGPDRRRGRGAGHRRPQPDGLGHLREAGRRRPCRPRADPAPSCSCRRVPGASPTRTCGPTACRRPASASWPRRRPRSSGRSASASTRWRRGSSTTS